MDRGAGTNVGRWKSVVLAAAGVATVIIIGALFVRGVGGSSAGAESPIDAVRQLASAAKDEDPAAALAAIDQRESRILTDVYRDLKAHSGGSGSERADGGLAGVDLGINGARFDSEELGPGVVKVRITGGRLDAGVNAAGLPAALGVDTSSSTTVDANDITSPGAFVLVREREGRWFVSPTLTGLQYLTELEGLPAPDFRELSKPDGGGGPSPANGNELLSQLVDAASQTDLGRVIELVSTDDAAFIRAYRAPLEALVNRSQVSVSAQVLSSDVQEQSVKDDLVRLDLANVRASGTAQSEGSTDSVFAELDGQQQCTVVNGARSCDTAAQRLLGVDRLFLMAKRNARGLRFAPIATAGEYLKLYLRQNAEVR